MLYSQKYTPLHCFFCNFSGWEKGKIFHYNNFLCNRFLFSSPANTWRWNVVWTLLQCQNVKAMSLFWRLLAGISNSIQYTWTSIWRFSNVVFWLFTGRCSMHRTPWVKYNNKDLQCHEIVIGPVRFIKDEIRCVFNWIVFWKLHLWKEEGKNI